VAWERGGRNAACCIWGGGGGGGLWSPVSRLHARPSQKGKLRRKPVPGDGLGRNARGKSDEANREKKTYYQGGKGGSLPCLRFSSEPLKGAWGSSSR